MPSTDKLRNAEQLLAMLDALERASRDAALRRRDWEGTLAERDRLIRASLAMGLTHAQVAEATGLTRGRVGQLASTRPNVGGSP